jgi:hypothetical protein
MIIWHHKNAARTILKMGFEYTASLSTKSLKVAFVFGGSISEHVRRVWSAAKQKGCKYEKGHNAQNSKLAKCLAMDSRRK